MQAEQLLFEIESPGREYNEFPKPPNHKDVPSLDPTMPKYAWSQEDWRLFMNNEHPYTKNKGERK